MQKTQGHLAANDGLQGPVLDAAGVDLGVSEADIDAEIRRSGCLRTDENRAVVRAQLEAARGATANKGGSDAR